MSRYLHLDKGVSINLNKVCEYSITHDGTADCQLHIRYVNGVRGHFIITEDQESALAKLTNNLRSQEKVVIQLSETAPVPVVPAKEVSEGDQGDQGDQDTQPPAEKTLPEVAPIKKNKKK